MAERKPIDWEAVEREYRAGQLSIREIARQYKLSAPAITQKAKRLDWSRDLSGQVRKEINARLVSEASAVNAEVNKRNAREIVNVAVARGVDVVIRHRKDIGKLDALKTRLADKAEVLMETIASIEQLADAAQVIESLGRTQARLIPLERQAFNLDDKSVPPDDVSLSDDDRAARLAALLERARARRDGQAPGGAAPVGAAAGTTD